MWFIFIVTAKGQKIIYIYMYIFLKEMKKDYYSFEKNKITHTLLKENNKKERML